MRKQLISFCAGNKVFVKYQAQGGVNLNPPLAYAFGVLLVTTKHCNESSLAVLWLSHIASILVDSCINCQLNASCTSITRWLCSLSTCLDRRASLRT